MTANGGFGDSLRFFRHVVKRVARVDLARELRKAAKRSKDIDSGLSNLTAEDIRLWEKGTGEPSGNARTVIARVMGVPLELLDPESGEHSFSPKRFLELAKQGGVGQTQIAHAWKLAKEGALFSGCPVGRDWEQVLFGMIPPSSQHSLLDEFWCTNCGHWESNPQLLCPRCHVSN